MYDLIIVGGGIAGSALALNMSRAGASVLVLEREAQYRDRIRGEGLHVWGSVDARELGVYGILLEHCALEVPFLTRYRDGEIAVQRDLAATTPSGGKEMTFFHPAMQETLIEAARDAGVEVWRSAVVLGVEPGDLPGVMVRRDGAIQHLSARLIVGADGRRSKVRGWAGFETRRDPDNLRIVGAIVRGIPAGNDSVHILSGPGIAWNTQLLPLDDGGYRCYFVTGDRDRHPAIGGAAGAARLADYMRDARVPEDWLDALEIEGPLTTFEAASWWVEAPYRDGVTLIGDAAAAPDPCFGNGLALALRDVRMLRDCLLQEDDWDWAAKCYAAAHDDTFGKLHRLEQWAAEAFYSVGDDKREVREHAEAATQRGEAPDLIGYGPDVPADDEARRRFLGY